MASIRQLKSGKFQAQVRHRGMRSAVKSFNTKADAERWARHLESEIDRGIFADYSEARRTTMAELIDRYLAEVTPAKKSVRQETQRLRQLKAHFGAIAPALLRNTDIAAYRDKRLKAGRAGATVVKELNSLSHLFDVAIKDWGLTLPTNPAKLVRRPSVARGRDRRLRPGEEAKILAACEASKAPLLAPVIRFAIATGMRRGEILALQWRNIDFAQRVATLPDTKNGEARQVPLSTAAIAALSTLPRHITDGRVFWTWARGDSFQAAWKRAFKLAGADDLRFHDLRHEAVSRFFEMGLNPMEVASISGHKTLQMLKRYTHLRAAELALKIG